MRNSDAVSPRPALSNLGASLAAAPRIAGMASRKMNRAASARRRPRSNATVSVAPDRDTPGTSATACAHPIQTASPRVSVRSPRVFEPARSATRSLIAPSASAIGRHDGRAHVLLDLILEQQSDDDRRNRCRRRGARSAAPPPPAQPRVKLLTFQPAKQAYWERVPISETRAG